MEDSNDDDDDDEYLEEENNSSNMPRQKESKIRGKRPTGNIKGRALATDFTNSASINENFPKYRDKNKYGQRNVPKPKSTLAEFGGKLRKARCVTQWRKMTPNQQSAVCEQIAAERKNQQDVAKEHSPWRLKNCGDRRPPQQRKLLTRKIGKQRKGNRKRRDEMKPRLKLQGYVCCALLCFLVLMSIPLTHNFT